MAIRGQVAGGHLIRNPSGFLTSRINREVSIWKKKKKESREGNVGRDCRFPDLPLPPNRCSPRPLHPLLPSRPSLLFCPLPLRPLLRPRSPNFPAIFSTMNAPDSSNPTAHGDKTVRVVIKGRVQGVFYRDWTVENAAELNLKGWVRNRRDGSVEALFSGDPESVDGMVERCRKGPPAAMVTGLDVSLSGDDPGTGFERRRTC